MWILSWKQYKLSKFATFVSVVGALTRYAGILCLLNGLIPAALICIAIGIGFHLTAEQIAFSAWKKCLKKEGIEDQIKQGNLEVASVIINGTTDKKIHDYIVSLNSNANSLLNKNQNK